MRYGVFTQPRPFMRHQNRQRADLALSVTNFEDDARPSDDRYDLPAPLPDRVLLGHLLDYGLNKDGRGASQNRRKCA
jgi:hypothetical protein